MIKKAYKILMVIFIVIVVVFGGTLATIANTFSANKGEIPGTGFINQEMSGTSSSYFDVDSKGNIYFAISKMFGNYVSVYDPNGVYLYTLYLKSPGNISVRIDNKDNITVYDSKANSIYIFNQKGQLIDTQYIKYTTEFSSHASLEKPDGKLYQTDGSTLTVTANGKTTVLYRKPFWQMLDEISFGILMASFALLIAAQVIKYVIPMAIERYGGK